ncbi:hypothetical protein ACS0TY_010904 [Phlomoides rotata]
MSKKKEIINGFVEMVTTLIRDKLIQRKCIDEVSIFQDRLGSFGRSIALDSSKTMQPGCERNWNVFERIHTKKRNKLEHSRLNDLVFIHYNLRLQERLERKRICYDPIDYESIDQNNSWVVEEEE